MTRYILVVDIPASAVEADLALSRAATSREGATITTPTGKVIDVDIVGVERQRSTSDGTETSVIVPMSRLL